MTSPRTEALSKADRAHVWHPFSQMEDYAATEPLIVESASGNWLVDTEGNRYLDAVSSLWCNVHGHRVDEIDAAIRMQLDRVAHTTLLGTANVPSIQLAEILSAIAPEGLSHVFYAENGASAVEIALKVAYQHWQQRDQPERRLFLGFENAYHGDTLGAVSVGGIDLFLQKFRPLLFDTLRAPSPYLYRCPDGHTTLDECGHHCLQCVDDLLATHPGQVCAVILEPVVQGAAGIVVQPAGFVGGLRELCDRHDTLLILDEVATGFGRTGRMFACEHDGVSPEILVLGKGLTGGYLPLSAVLVTDEVYESFLGGPTSARTLYHGHTYTGNQLCCAAALANLALFERDSVISVAEERGLELSALLEPLHALEHVGEVRQRGLMVGIELAADARTRRDYAPGLRMAWNLCMRMRRRGILIRPLGDVVVLMPPLSITSTELELLVGELSQEVAALS